jgi:hypothetical protein
MSDGLRDGANPLAELIAGIRRLIPEPDVAHVADADADAGADAATGEQWRELATAVDELVEVVLVQQDLLENVLMRMSRLEGREVTPRKTRRGA